MDTSTPQPESPIVTAIRTAESPEQISRILTEANELRPSGKTRRYWLRVRREVHKQHSWPLKKPVTFLDYIWQRKPKKVKKPSLSLSSASVPIKRGGLSRHKGVPPKALKHPLRSSTINDPRFNHSLRRAKVSPAQKA